MGRLACVDVPDLLLQEALREHPDRIGLPVAVVAEDRPQASILQTSPEARRRGVQPGMRLMAAMGLVPDLVGMAASVHRESVARDRLIRVASAFSPTIEASREHPGTLWADLSGMQGLFPTVNAWGRAFREALAREGYQASVVAGFSRFATWALARTGPGLLVLRSRDREREALFRVPLGRLSLSPDRWDALAGLGIRTVGDLLGIPRAGLAARLGAEVEALHRAAAGEGEEPLRPVVLEDPLREEEAFENRQENPDCLLFVAKRLLDRILGRLAIRGRAVRALVVRWRLDDLMIPSRQGDRRPPEVCWTLRPADPVTEGLPLLTLLRLRLESSPLPAPVTGISLEVEAILIPVGQLRLFRETRRDLWEARAVLARLRARFGEEAVVRPRQKDAWIPEEEVRWVPGEDLQRPRPRKAGAGPRVRRLLPAPVPLPISREEILREGLRLEGLGTIRSWRGPFLVSGGWWRTRETRREYLYLVLRDGQILWVFREDGRWWLQGRVE